MEQAAQPVKIAHHRGAVEAHLLAQLLVVCLARVDIGNPRSRVAGENIHQKEQNDAGHQQNRDHRE